jgi:hypothetical protein
MCIRKYRKLGFLRLDWSQIEVWCNLCGMCVYIHACIHTCIHACMHKFTSCLDPNGGRVSPKHTCMHQTSYMHTCMHQTSYMHTCMHQTSCIHTCIHVCVPRGQPNLKVVAKKRWLALRMHTYIHAHIHTYIARVRWLCLCLHMYINTCIDS